MRTIQNKINSQKKTAEKFEFNKTLKPAFTLAEVLITLGIIGVVAAMTLPTLTKNIRNNELETGFKKGHTILQQHFKFMKVDEGDFDPALYDTTRSFLPFFEKRLKGTRCTEFSSINCINMADGGNIYKNFSGKSKAFAIWFDDGQFTLTDGMFVMLNNSTGEPLCVSIDINGRNRKPNQWGKDLFTFQFVKDELLPMGAEGTKYPLEDHPEYCDTNNTDQLNGINCAYKAMQDKNYFKGLK